MESLCRISREPPVRSTCVMLSGQNLIRLANSETRACSETHMNRMNLKGWSSPASFKGILQTPLDVLQTGSNHLSLHREENAAATVDQPCERSPLHPAKSCKFSSVRSGWSHTRQPHQGLTKALRWNARPTHPAGSGVPFSLGTAKDQCLNRSVENYILDGHLKHCWGVVCLNEKRHACKTARGPESSLPSPQLAVPALPQDPGAAR